MHDVLDSFGTPNSVYPPTKYLTFGPWIFLVPQFKPESVLILGFAGGTVAGLIRLLYGDDVKITAVDEQPCERGYNTVFIQCDAQDFVKTCKPYDVVIVDLFPNDSQYVCDFVTTVEFVANLKRIARYVIVNTVNNPDMGAYYRVFHHVGTSSPIKLGNKIYYFEREKIEGLRP